MRALIILFLLTNCLNLQPKTAAKAAPTALQKSSTNMFHLAVPIIGGFLQDETNMFEEAEQQNLGENPGMIQGGEGGNGGGGGGLITSYHQFPGMNRQLSTTYHPGIRVIII